MRSRVELGRRPRTLGPTGGAKPKISHYLPTGVRSWQADVVRQSSRCRLDSDCFPLSLASATHIFRGCLRRGRSKPLPKQTSLARMVSHWDKGRRPKNRAPPFSAQVSLVYARGICSAGHGYASTWYFGTDCCSAPYSNLTSAVSIWCSPWFFFRVSLSKQPFIPGHPGATAQNWRTFTTRAGSLGRVTCERTLLARFERPHITRRSALSVSALTRALSFPSWRASALI